MSYNFLFLACRTGEAKMTKGYNLPARYEYVEN